MDEKYLNDPIVSLMKSMGFSDEYIMANVKIEKSENGAAAGDHESETKEEKDINKLEKEAVKDEEKVKEDEVRAKLPASGNVHGNGFPTERRPLHRYQ